MIGGGLPLQPGCATGLRDSRLSLDDPDADWIGLFVDVAGGSECVVGDSYIGRNTALHSFDDYRNRTGLGPAQVKGMKRHFTATTLPRVGADRFDKRDFVGPIRHSVI